MKPAPKSSIGVKLAQSRAGRTLGTYVLNILLGVFISILAIRDLMPLTLSGLTILDMVVILPAGALLMWDGAKGILAHWNASNV